MKIIQCGKSIIYRIFYTRNLANRRHYPPLYPRKTPFSLYFFGIIPLSIGIIFRFFVHPSVHPSVYPTPFSEKNRTGIGRVSNGVQRVVKSPVFRFYFGLLRRRRVSSVQKRLGVRQSLVPIAVVAYTASPLRAFFERELYFCHPFARPDYNRTKKAALFAAPNDTEIIPNYTFRFNRPSSWVSCNSLFLFTLTSYFSILYFVLFVFPPLCESG